MTKNLDRAVLITGATGSVGESLVAVFAGKGYRVSFLYHRSKSRAHAMAEKFGATPIQEDLSRPIDLANKEVDILINNAAINETSELTGDLPLEDWDRTIALNLTAPFLLIRQCLPHMVRENWGRIVNISSIYGLRAVETNLPYTVSKHGLSGLTKTVAREYGAAWHHVQRDLPRTDEVAVVTESRIIYCQSRQREDCFQKAVIKRGLRRIRRSALRARSSSSQ